MFVKPLIVSVLLLLALAGGLGLKVLNQAQTIGAYQDQAQRDRTQLAAERARRAEAAVSIARHRAAEQQAVARATELDNRLQEAKRHDLATQDWAQACGTRDLPCAYREWLLGHPPAGCEH